MSDPVYIGYYTLTDAVSMPNNARFIMYDPAGPGSYNITGALLKSQILASPVITGQAIFTAGTAALPILTTAGDTNTGIYFPAADTVGIATGGTERLRITSAGNVLVGTSTNDGVNRIQVQSAGKTGAVFIDSNSYATGVGGGIKFAGRYDATNSATFAGIQGEKENSTSGNYAGALVFLSRAQGEGTSERARITSAGELLVGTSSQILPGYQVQADSSNNSVAGSYWRNNSTGTGANVRIGLGSSNDVFQIVKYGSGYTARSNETHFYNGVGDMYFSTNAGTERLRITQGGNILVGTSTDPGYGSKIHSTAGISLGNTAVANGNVLDWYEEGTFTPTVVGSTTAGTGTYTTQIGRYTRIGRSVSIQIQLTWTAHTGTGTMTIAGLPFANISTTAATPLAVSYDGLVVGAGKQLCAYVGTNFNSVMLAACDLAGGSVSPLAIDSAVNLLLISGTYFVP